MKGKCTLGAEMVYEAQAYIDLLVYLQKGIQKKKLDQVSIVIIHLWADDINYVLVKKAFLLFWIWVKLFYEHSK